MAETGVIPGSTSDRTYLTFMRPLSQTSGADPNSPDYVTDACKEMEDRSWLCRVFAEGVPAVHKNIEHLLPQQPNEDGEDYKIRLRYSSFRNFYAQATKSILGKMFGQPPALKEDVPEPIRSDLEDADLNGKHWTVLAKNLAEHALNEGVCWLMIDYHNVDVERIGNLSMAEERRLGLRPYWIVIPQHRVLGYTYEKVGNVYTLTQFRYRETITVKDGQFGEKYEERIRVINPDYTQVYTMQHSGRNAAKKQEWVPSEILPNTLGRVPVICFNLDPRDHYTSAPPLENLAYMNLEHFQIRSDQRRALQVASFPILASFGVMSNQGIVRIGPMTSINIENPQGDLRWIESTGVHLKAGADELVKLESEMRTFGLSFENPQMYATATGRNIDASDAIAPIQFWAILLKDVLEIALMTHAEWRKLPSGGSVDVNTSFLKNMITIEGLRLLVEAFKEGALSREGFLQRMKEYGLLSDDFNPDDDIKKLLAELKEKLAMAPPVQNRQRPVGGPNNQPSTQGDSNENV